MTKLRVDVKSPQASGLYICIHVRASCMYSEQATLQGVKDRISFAEQLVRLRRRVRPGWLKEKVQIQKLN